MVVEPPAASPTRLPRDDEDAGSRDERRALDDEDDEVRSSYRSQRNRRLAGRRLMLHKEWRPLDDGADDSHTAVDETADDSSDGHRR